MEILNQWAFIGVFFIIAPVLPAVPILLAAVISPRKPNAIKQATYECGVETVGDTWVQFKVQYYIYGLIFLIFDVEMVFFVPMGISYKQLDFFGFFAGLLFIFLLSDALVYAWRKNVLKWV